MLLCNGLVLLLLLFISSLLLVLGSLPLSLLQIVLFLLDLLFVLFFCLLGSFQHFLLPFGLAGGDWGRGRGSITGAGLGSTRAGLWGSLRAGLNSTRAGLGGSLRAGLSSESWATVHLALLELDVVGRLG